MSRNHLSGGEATGDQRGSNGTRAATVCHEFRAGQKLPTPQELEEAKARAERAEAEAAAWKADAATAHLKNQELRASLLEAVEALKPFANIALNHLWTGTYGPSWGFNGGVITHELFIAAAQVHARLSSSPEGGEGSGWLPIESAPKDGTWIQARIPGHGEDNIILWVADALEDGNGSCGAWAFALEDQEPPDCWSDGWCWAVNEDGVRSAWPTHWKLPPPPEHQAGE